ncbi:hypothetical protein B2O45_24855 [Salmonella enterica]|uniref:Uncharacterized protein n=1 Tax=Salmonella enterica TaxID=28901 RepID=A0A5U7S0B0_SALER|nr:hypothetical protein [Salmonella enterica]
MFPLRFAGKHPSSRFRGISSPTMRLSVSYSTVGIDPRPCKNSVLQYLSTILSQGCKIFLILTVFAVICM